jgi:mannose-6-phosphate isomerase-like protein (cupin superfamily)
MSEYIKRVEKPEPHPREKGVTLKHFFNSTDNDRLNNLELTLQPGSQVSEHIHESSTEFYYVVSGSGECLSEGEWVSVKAGDAFKAPVGEVHALRNPGSVPFVLFITFSPANR